MRNNTTNYTPLLIVLVLVLMAVLVQLIHANNNLKRLYEYGAEADMCWQEVEQFDYYHRTCQVEREGNTYHWYNRAIEERSNYDITNEL